MCYYRDDCDDLDDIPVPDEDTEYYDEEETVELELDEIQESEPYDDYLAEAFPNDAEGYASYQNWLDDLND